MNIGFLGCSKIGARIVEALKENKDAVLYGCAAQDSKRAEEYKEKFGFKKFYNSYLELVQDPNIDLVYVSTLISSHYNDVKLCLENNKPCLVEKAFTINSKEAEELIKISKQKNLFLGSDMDSLYAIKKNDK